MVSCIGPPHELQEVRNGLDVTVAQLPSSSCFDIVTVLSGASSSRDYGSTCYYAQAGLAIGTSLSEEDALKTYTDELMSQGWVLKQNDLERSRVLIRGQHERITVGLGGPGWMMEADEDYQRAKQIYPAFLFVTVTFVLPGREGC